MAGFGAFGKIPAMGDFFRVGLANSFVEPWDAWLQDGMRRVRAELNDQWNACYMSAPIWRFTVGAGLMGPDAMMGVLMPSVDRVGRQFPLTLAVPLGRVADVPLAHFCAKQQFEELERVALGALEDGFTKDMLVHRLRQVGAPQLGSHLHENGESGTVCLIGQDTTAHLAAAALRGKPNQSVWSADMDRDSPMLLSAAMPSSVQMRGLFDLSAPIWAASPQVEAAQ